MFKRWSRRRRNSKKQVVSKFGVAASDMDEVPSFFVDSCLKIKDDFAQGIFRISANRDTINDLKEKIDNEELVDMFEQSVHTCCGLVKYFLRELPTPLLEPWYEGLCDNGESAEGLGRLLVDTPEVVYRLTKTLFETLHFVTSNDRDARSLMPPENLALIFAPTLFRKTGASAVSMLTTGRPQDEREAILTMIQQFDEVFVV